MEQLTTQTKRKPGRKPSAVIRKSTMFNLSEQQSEGIDKLADSLKSLGVTNGKRGRSEAIELAVQTIRVALNSDSNRVWILSILKDAQGKEERETEDD